MRIWRKVVKVNDINTVVDAGILALPRFAVGGELCVCVLVDLTGMKYSALSYHLKQLKDVGLIDSEKGGTYLLYRLTSRGKSFQKLILKYANEK